MHRVNYPLAILLLCQALICVLVHMTMTKTARANDVEESSWIFRPSYFSHHPATGERVAQYVPERTPFARFDPSYVESGYRQSSQNIITSDGSYDQQRTVQSWGYAPYGGWGGYYGFGAPFYGPYGYTPLGYPATSQTPFPFAFPNVAPTAPSN